MKVSELLRGAEVLRSVIQSLFKAQLHRFQVGGPWANCLSTQGLCLDRGDGNARLLRQLRRSDGARP